MRHRILRHRILRLIAISSVTLLLPALASAQSSVTDRLQRGPIVGGGEEKRAPKPAPAPGLPGASVNADRVAPSERLATDMQPTDALFDAINRGDIGSARDALARGADFNARNVLGLTPLDQSIDLSRNDITFLLLSLRGAAPPQVASTPQNKGGKSSPAKEAAARPAPTKPVVVTAQRPIPQRPTPSDGGTANPTSGFLGFGG
jgi:hypothetical protein